jgi:glycosyltransferase involved in cell wall biosynthesis
MKIAAYAQLHRSAIMPTGVGQHLIHMIRGLQGRPGIDLRVLAARTQLDYNGKIPLDNPLTGIAARGLPLDRRWLELSWHVLKRPNIDRWSGDVDWIYSPTEVYIPTRRPQLAITIHDLHAFERDLPWSETAAHRAFRKRWARMLEPAIAHASCVLTVSEFTRGRLVKLLKVDPNRVAVVGNGVNPVYFERADDAGDHCARDQPYVIVVGGLTRRKGGDRVLRMAQALGIKLPRMQVLVAGQSEAEFMVQAAGLGNVTLLHYVPTRELASLMRHAVAAVLLSHYEGFGIPVLEAMACGAPVISSRAGALPEVVGNAGLLLDADDPKEIVRAIEWLWMDEDARESYRALGRLRAQNYHWDRCVDRLLGALQSR